MKRVTTEDLREDLEGNTELAPIDEPEVDMPDEQTPAAAVDATSELESDYKDIDDVDTGIDAAVDAQEQISELKQAVEVNGEDGKSLSTGEELSVNVAMESIYASLGYQWTPPTMESVTYRKRRETVVATLEASVGDLRDKIVAGFKKAMTMLMDFITNLLRNNWVIKKYIGAMRERLKNHKGEAPTQQTMPESSTAMSVDGKADFESVTSLYKTAIAGLDLTDKAVDKVNKLNFTYMEEVSTTISGEFNPVNVMRPHRGDVNGGVGFLTGERAYIAHNLIAGMVMDATSVFKSIQRVAEPATEATVLDKNQMGEVLSKAEDIIKEIAHAERNRSKLKNIVSRVTQFIAGVGGIYAGVVSKAGTQLSWNVANISAVRKLLNSIVGTMPLEAFKTAKALTDYVRHSLKYYKSAEA